MFGWVTKLPGRLHGWWVRHCPEQVMTDTYLKLGRKFGVEMRSNAFTNGVKAFRKLVRNLAIWEEEYVRRGFRAMTIEDWHNSINDWGVAQHVPAFRLRLGYDELPKYPINAYYRDQICSITSPDDELQRRIDESIPEYLVCTKQDDNERTFGGDYDGFCDDPAEQEKRRSG